MTATSLPATLCRFRSQSSGLGEIRVISLTMKGMWNSCPPSSLATVASVRIADMDRGLFIMGRLLITPKRSLQSQTTQYYLVDIQVFDMVLGFAHKPFRDDDLLAKGVNKVVW